jgi:hypothetical protein
MRARSLACGHIQQRVTDDHRVSFGIPHATALAGPSPRMDNEVGALHGVTAISADAQVQMLIEPKRPRLEGRDGKQVSRQHALSHERPPCLASVFH